MSSVTKQKSLLLPHLDQDLSPPNPGGAAADWGAHGGGLGALAKYSDALVVVGRDTPAERLKSIPTPWSRLLIFEQALFTHRHPAHQQVLGEWRGLLGAIALSRYLGLALGAGRVELGGTSGVMEELRALTPADGARELWDQLALIQLDGATVGATSPRTLVFTGIRGRTPPGVPFQRAGRLSDPTAHYRELGDRSTLRLLEGWLQRVVSELEARGDGLERLLGFQPASPGTEPVSRGAHLRTLLGQWLRETETALQVPGGGTGEEVAFASESPLADAFPQSHPAHAVFAVLQPVSPPQSASRRSDLRVREGERIVNPGVSGVLFRGVHPFTGWVNLPAGQNRQVHNGRFQERVDPAHLGDASAPDLGTLFQPRLIELVGADTTRVAVLRSGGKEYLIPFAAAILEHLDPDVLIASVRTSGDVAAGLRVTLEIPVQNGLSVRWERTYFSHDVVDDFTTPDLAVWPDFESGAWQHYFYFFHQTRVRQNLAPRPVVSVLDEFVHGPDGWGRTALPPRAWTVSADADNGLLLMLPLPRVETTSEPWDVSIDFGSTHTRVFRATQGLQGHTVPMPVSIRPRTLDLLGQSALLSQDFFIGARDGVTTTDEPRSLVRLPLGNAGRGTGGEWLPSRGIIYWKSIGESGQADGLRANLKWHRRESEDLPAFHSYISQLYLSIAAEAAAGGSRVSSVITAYPSVFPAHLRHSHEAEWGTLQSRYGVAVRPPIAESSALAAYLVSSRGAAAAANLLAIDVGGSTSDLAVWTRNTRASGDSVRLAGDLLTRVIGANPAMQQAVSRAAANQPISAGPLPWRPSPSSENGLILNDLLRTLTQKFGSTQTLARNLYQGPRSEGERIIAYAGYLYAAVSFLLGMMVRRAGVRQPLYEIYFAGRGSEFLSWLDLIANDASSAVPKAFFRAGLGPDGSQAEILVHPPGNTAKHEVGSGLLAPPLDFGAPARERLTFVGETGFQNDAGALDWSADLGVEALCGVQRPDQPVELAKLEAFQRFIKAFEEGEGPQTIARALNISPDTAGSLELRNRVHEKLFGPHSAWQACHAADNAADQTLLEPFFIVEAKALLEFVTGQPGLFNG